MLANLVCTSQEPISVAMAWANIFAILGNKIAKNLKIIVEIDES